MTRSDVNAWRNWWFVIPGAIVMVIGFGAFFVKKRKEENENQKST